MKALFILQFLLLIFFLQTASCNRQENSPMVKWKGPNDKNDLVFFYKNGISYEQKQTFQNEILSKPRSDGRGFAAPDGVEDMMFGTIINDYEGGIINFSKSSTPEQREKIKKALRESPIVYEVYENVVPSEIRDL